MTTADLASGRPSTERQHESADPLQGLLVIDLPGARAGVKVPNDDDARQAFDC
jgi:hypothetical protein